MGGFQNGAEAVAADAGEARSPTRENARPVIVDNDHKAIMTGLHDEFERARLARDTSCMCVVSPDGDRVAQVIDGFGIRFVKILRSHDAMYRFAPDKFLLLMPSMGQKEALAAIIRLRDRAVREPISLPCGAEQLVTASIGATMLDTRAPLHDHIDNVSRAHTMALKGGGDRICMWAPEV